MQFPSFEKHPPCTYTIGIISFEVLNIEAIKDNFGGGVQNVYMIIIVPQKELNLSYL
jgi:hypothetical protein